MNRGEWRAENFSEDICWLVSDGNDMEMKSVALKMMANKIAIILNVLYLVMKYITMCNLNSTTVITMKNSG